MTDKLWQGLLPIYRHALQTTQLNVVRNMRQPLPTLKREIEPKDTNADLKTRENRTVGQE